MEAESIYFAITVLAGIIVLWFFIKWLLQPGQGNYFNHANLHYKRLRPLLDQPSEFQVEALDVIRFCQLELEERPLSGDAHVLLATTYYLLADCFKETAIYNYCMPQAIAVIKQWHFSTMYTKNARQGHQIYQDMLEQLKIISSLDSALAKEITINEKKWYKIATDSSKLVELKLLVESTSSLMEASKFWQQEHHTKALGNCTKVIAMDSHNAYAYYLRSMAYLDLHDTKAALADANRAIALEANCYHFAGRAYIHFQMEEYDQAVTDLDHAIELCPEFVGAYARRGMALYSLGRRHEAITDFSYYLANVSGDDIVDDQVNMIKALLSMDKFAQDVTSIAHPL